MPPTLGSAVPLPDREATVAVTGIGSVVFEDLPQHRDSSLARSASTCKRALFCSCGRGSVGGHARRAYARDEQQQHQAAGRSLLLRLRLRACRRRRPGQNGRVLLHDRPALALPAVRTEIDLATRETRKARILSTIAFTFDRSVGRRLHWRQRYRPRRWCWACASSGIRCLSGGGLSALGILGSGPRHELPAQADAGMDLAALRRDCRKAVAFESRRPLGYIVAVSPGKGSSDATVVAAVTSTLCPCRTSGWCTRVRCMLR